MAHHHPSLQLVPTEMPSTDAWIDEVLAGKFENLLKLKNTVNKSVRDSDELGSNELKQFELVFNSDKEFFGIFRKDSEIAELFQVPCVHLLSKDSKKFENLQMSESSNIKFGFVKTSRHICPRCRLFLAEKTNELCLRCFNILNWFKLFKKLKYCRTKKCFEFSHLAYWSSKSGYRIFILKITCRQNWKVWCRHNFPSLLYWNSKFYFLGYKFQNNFQMNFFPKYARK